MKMINTSALLLGLFVSAGCFAAAPPDAPAGATGQCKDGTYYTGAEKKGACKGHKGVKEWYAEAPAAKTETKSTAAKSAAPPAATTATASSPPAAGGGPGQVWVNTKSKVYHCQGDKYYGKTKQGEYMTEAAAKAAGNHPDHGKACS
jgi:hypothetical protein